MSAKKMPVILNINSDSDKGSDDITPEVTSIVCEEYLEKDDTPSWNQVFPYALKKKRGRALNNTKRSFLNRWMKKPELKPWLVAAPEVPYYVKCKWCKVYLRAHLHDLKKHNESTKHRKQSLKHTAEHFNPTTTDIFISKLDEEENPVHHIKETITAATQSKEILIKAQDHVLHEDLGQDSFSPAQVGFIGCGNLTQSLLSGLLRNGLVDPSNAIVSAPSTKNLQKLAPLKIKTTHNNIVVIQESDIVFLCLKAHVIPEVLASLELSKNKKSPLFVSVSMGHSIAQLEAMLSQVVMSPRVVRALPNLPCMVSEGCSVFSCGSNVEISEANVLKCLLGSLGLCEEIPETQLDAACSIAASGSAFIYAVIESMADGAVKMGLPRTLATAMVAQTVKGSGSMVLETGKHPAQLRDEVCSPGGPTIAAMHLLEKGGLRGLMMSAVEAAAEKSKEDG